MKIMVVLAAAGLVSALAIATPSTAAPLSGTALAAQSAKVDANITQEVRHRRWHRRNFHRRHLHRRHWHRRHWRPYGFYRPYYGLGPGWYGPAWYGPGWGPGWGWRRPGVYLRFGF